MRAPEFWYRRRLGLAPRLLAPMAAAYGLAGRVRSLAVNPWRAPVPVVCVGNLVAGGAGKTPVAIDIGRRLADRGRNVHFLSRGYGGSISQPTAVDPTRHTAGDVGDEPLLLVLVRPTWVAADRGAGARAAVSAGAEAVVMDDGFQNPGLYKDLALVVVDGRRGFGNGRVIPAGPLREPVAAGLSRADAVVILGEDQAGVAGAVAPVPIHCARLVPEALPVPAGEKPVVAFAGIADPSKFFATVREAGYDVLASHGFPDHHPYAADDLAPIFEDAERQGAIVMTTAKDRVRLPRTYAGEVAVLSVRIAWEDEAALEAMLSRAMTDDD